MHRILDLLEHLMISPHVFPLVGAFFVGIWLSGSSVFVLLDKKRKRYVRELAAAGIVLGLAVAAGAAIGFCYLLPDAWYLWK
jgi:uncharacterized membrane protein